MPTEPSTAAPVPAPKKSSSPGKSSAVLKWALLFLPVGYLWFLLIDNLWLEWDTNPQYSYGMVVPLLVAGLLLRRWMNYQGDPQGSPVANPWFIVLPVVLLAFLFLPTRLIEAATPEWRPIQWLTGLETVGLTLYAIYLAGGKSWLRQAAFPVLFFLVAIPWPSPIEQPVIQGLSRMNAALVVEVMGILGVPAMQHGNVIEVSTGMVGINDACSGIRSFQSCLMIALFLGEYYFFSWRRRLLLLPIGFALALGFNLCRASLLTWIAAQKGIAAIAEYHDEAGFTIMLACTAVLWSVAWLMGRRKPTPAPAAAKTGEAEPLRRRENPLRLLKRFAITLFLWLVIVNVGVELWYRFREAQIKPGPTWTVNFPVNDPSYQDVPMTPEEHELLQFDSGEKGQWQEPDGTFWQAFYFNWLPGRVAGYLAKRHTPDICLTAIGLKMVAGPKLYVMNVHGIDLPMRAYIFDTSNGPLQVFQCHWEAGLGREDFTADESSRLNLIRGIWAGRGNQGQKVLEIVISGYTDPDLARQSLEHQLDSLIKVEPTVSKK
jgi:exosortase